MLFLDIHKRRGGDWIIRFYIQKRPILNLRCEWCKELFPWKLNPDVIEKMGGVRRTCSDVCQRRLTVWENDRRRYGPLNAKTDNATMHLEDRTNAVESAVSHSAECGLSV